MTDRIGENYRVMVKVLFKFEFYTVSSGKYYSRDKDWEVGEPAGGDKSG